MCRALQSASQDCSYSYSPTSDWSVMSVQIQTMKKSMNDVAITSTTVSGQPKVLLSGSKMSCMNSRGLVRQIRDGKVLGTNLQVSIVCKHNQGFGGTVEYNTAVASEYQKPRRSAIATGCTRSAVPKNSRVRLWRRGEAGRGSCKDAASATSLDCQDCCFNTSYCNRPLGAAWPVLHK